MFLSIISVHESASGDILAGLALSKVSFSCTSVDMKVISLYVIAPEEA